MWYLGPQEKGPRMGAFVFVCFGADQQLPELVPVVVEPLPVEPLPEEPAAEFSAPDAVDD
jgi:hypothetical protein